MRSLWPSGGLWRHPDFLKLWSAETISQFGTQVTQLALPLAAMLVLDASAFEVAALGVVEFLPFILFTLPAGRLGRPAAAAADPHRRRLRAGCAARDDPDRVRRRRADARAALRRRIPRRRLHGLLRRRVHVVHPVARRARPDHRGQLEARDQPLGGSDRRPGPRRRARPDLHRAVRDLVDAVSFVASGLFVLRIRKHESRPSSAPVDGAKGRRLDGVESGPPLRPREPEPSRSGGLHGHLQLLLERRVRDHPRLPRA